MSVAQLTAEDTAAYVAFRLTEGRRGGGTSATAATFLRRLERDWRCSAVRSDGTIIHVAWTAFERAHVEYLDRDLLLAPDEVFWFDAYTHPDWRRTDASAVRSEHDRRYLQARGCQRSLAIVARENAVGAAYASALGFRPIGWYAYWRLGPLSRWREEAIGGEAVPPLVEPQ